MHAESDGGHRKKGRRTDHQIAMKDGQRRGPGSKGQRTKDSNTKGKRQAKSGEYKEQREQNTTEGRRQRRRFHETEVGASS